MCRKNLSEIIEKEHIARHTKVLQHTFHCIGHRPRAAHIVFYIFRSIVILQIVVIDHLVDKAHIACPVIFRLRIGKSDMELEVRKFSLYLAEVFFIENLVFGAGTIPITLQQISSLITL